MQEEPSKTSLILQERSVTYYKIQISLDISGSIIYLIQGELKAVQNVCSSWIATHWTIVKNKQIDLSKELIIKFDDDVSKYYVVEHKSKQSTTSKQMVKNMDSVFRLEECE